MNKHNVIAVFGLLSSLLIGWFPVSVQGKELRADPSNYRSLLRDLTAGDSLLLDSGVYLSGLPIHNLNGTARKAIVIRSADSNAKAKFLARKGANTVSIVDSSYVTLSDIELEGNGLPVDAVKAEGHSAWAHDIILSGLTIAGHGASQQTVGISTKCPSWNWVIRGNTILGAGTGLYLGDSDGSAPFVAGVIEDNLVLDSQGYNLQIKHQETRPRLPGMPAHAQTIIRSNVFFKGEGSALDGAARPSVLVGHWPRSGDGSEDMYLIYNNFFYQNPTEALFQGEGNIALYNNLFVSAGERGGSAIVIRPHNDVPRKIGIYFNTIVASRRGIYVAGFDREQSQVVVGNAVFAEPAISGDLGDVQFNLVGGGSLAALYLSDPLGSIGKLDLYPRNSRIRRFALPRERWPQLPDIEQDFNGMRRSWGYPGAYEGHGANPGWKPALERIKKVEPVPSF